MRLMRSLISQPSWVSRATGASAGIATGAAAAKPAIRKERAIICLNNMLRTIGAGGRSRGLLIHRKLGTSGEVWYGQLLLGNGGTEKKEKLAEGTGFL